MLKSILAVITMTAASTLAQADIGPIEQLGRFDGRTDGLKTIVSSLEMRFQAELSTSSYNTFVDEIVREVQVLQGRARVQTSPPSPALLQAVTGNNEYLTGFMDGFCQAYNEAWTLNQERKTRYHGNMERYDAATAIAEILDQLKHSKFEFCN